MVPAPMTRWPQVRLSVRRKLPSCIKVKVLRRIAKASCRTPHSVLVTRCIVPSPFIIVSRVASVTLPLRLIMRTELASSDARSRGRCPKCRMSRAWLVPKSPSWQKVRITWWCRSRMILLVRIRWKSSRCRSKKAYSHPVEHYCISRHNNHRLRTTTTTQSVSSPLQKCRSR